MPRKKKEVKETPIEDVSPIIEEQTEEITPVLEEVKPSEPKKLEDVSVFDTNGNLIRVYAKEVHGENFYQLAEQFILRRPGYTLK